MKNQIENDMENEMEVVVCAGVYRSYLWLVGNEKEWNLSYHWCHIGTTIRIHSVIPCSQEVCH